MLYHYLPNRYVLGTNDIMAAQTYKIINTLSPLVKWQRQILIKIIFYLIRERTAELLPGLYSMLSFLFFAGDIGFESGSHIS
jgi:hypothetical protein